MAEIVVPVSTEENTVEDETVKGEAPNLKEDSAEIEDTTTNNEAGQAASGGNADEKKTYKERQKEVIQCEFCNKSITRHSLKPHLQRCKDHKLYLQEQEENKKREEEKAKQEELERKRAVRQGKKKQKHVEIKEPIEKQEEEETQETQAAEEVQEAKETVETPPPAPVPLYRALTRKDRMQMLARSALP